MTEQEVRDRLRVVYVDGSHDLAFVERIGQIVVRLRQHVSEIFNRPAAVHNIPQEVNYYYTIECCLTNGCPEFYNELELMDQPPSRAEYFQMLCSVVVPVTAGVWHGFRRRADGTFEHDMFDLFDEGWLSTHPEHELVALKLAAAVESIAMSMLGWDVLLAPADRAWPSQPYSPEDAELRHYIFPGFYEDWRRISKPVRAQGPGISDSSR